MMLTKLHIDKLESLWIVFFLNHVHNIGVKLEQVDIQGI